MQLRILDQLIEIVVHQTVQLIENLQDQQIVLSKEVHQQGVRHLHDNLLQELGGIQLMIIHQQM